MSYLHLKINGDSVVAHGQSRFDIGRRVRGASAGAGFDDGVYASWQWDGQALELSNCRFGVYPLFYVHRGAEFVVADSIVELMNHAGPLRFDDDAIAVFLRIGFFLNDDTPFKEVKALPPAASWRWSRAGLVRQHRMPGSAFSCAATRDCRLDDYIDLFRDAMKRRPAGDSVVHPLSGGRDSRHILFELVRSDTSGGGRAITCVTAESKSLEDVRIARLVCKELGLPHEVVPRDDGFVAAAQRKNLLTSFCSDEHTWALPMCEWVNRNAVTVYDGLGGDVLSAGLFSTTGRLKALRSGNLAAFIDDLFRFGDGELQRWLRPAARQRFARERAAARAAEAIAPHCERPNPVASFFLHNRTRREIALYSCGLFRPDTTLYLPYLDHAIVDYLMSIPGEELDDKKFHTDAISRAYPQWSTIPYALDERDPQAIRVSDFDLRRQNVRTAVDLGLHLFKRRDPWIDRWAIAPRLAALCFAKEATHSAYWFNTERIIWATQLARAAGAPEM
jgi:asparagine synthetase B (glutamine-hydrolysing)